MPVATAMSSAKWLLSEQGRRSGETDGEGRRQKQCVKLR